MPQGDFRRLVEELAGEALGDHLRNVRSFSELRRAVSAGDLTDREVSEAYTDYAQRNGPAYRRAASDLTMRYYQDLSELSARYSDEFYGEILNGSHAAYGARNGSEPPPSDGPSAARPADSPEVERIPIELHGKIGHEVAARFTIENTDPAPRTITFEFAPCRAPHGEVFNAPVTVQPGTLELEPGASAAVVLRVAFMPSVFLPGLIYQQQVTVAGAKPLILDVTLWVEAEGGEEPPGSGRDQKHGSATGATQSVTAEAATAATVDAKESTPTPAGNTAAKKTAAKPTATKPTVSAAKATTAKSPAEKVPAKKAAAKKAPAKKAVAKKAPAKKAAAKKAPAKKATGKRATKKAPAKKTAAKKASAKKATGS